MRRNENVGLPLNYCKEIAILHAATLLLMVCGSNADGVAPLRLISGSSSSEGRLEILLNNTWGTVCDDFFTASYEGAVACRQLNFTGILRLEASQYFGEGSGQIWLDDVHCIGNETSLVQCSHKRIHNCRHAEDVGVVCNTNHPGEDGAIQLVNGNRSSGRVEIFHNGEWGTVCNLNWGIEDATVVCRQLGFAGAVSTPEGPAYEEGVGLVWMSNVTCTGSEERLDRCQHNGWETRQFMCPHSKDANVVCDSKDLVSSPPLSTRDETNTPLITIQVASSTISTQTYVTNVVMVSISVCLVTSAVQYL